MIEKKPTQAAQMAALTQAVTDLKGVVEDQSKRLKDLEDTLKSGKGVLLGAAAVVGFLLADGIARIKMAFGLVPPS